MAQLWDKIPTQYCDWQQRKPGHVSVIASICDANAAREKF